MKTSKLLPESEAPVFFPHSESTCHRRVRNNVCCAMIKFLPLPWNNKSSVNCMFGFETWCVKYANANEITNYVIHSTYCYIKYINNGNWTEWSAIWSEIIRVISKSNERAARVWFEITSMISDQNCTTWSSIATSLHPFWNRTI